MGNKMAIKNYINNAYKKGNYSVSKDKAIDNKLKEVFPQYQQKTNQFYQFNNYTGEEIYIGKNVLRFCLQLSDDKNFEKIFEIFGEKNEKKEEIITFDSLKYLYYSFTNEDNPKIKFILISFLLFGKEEQLEINELRKIITQFEYNNDTLLNLFSNYNENLFRIINNKKVKHRHKNVEQKFIQRHEFIKNYELFEEPNKSDSLVNFHFLKKFTGSSLFKLEADNKNINSLDFYCDCSKNNIKIPDTSDNLYSMRKGYDDITYLTKKALMFTDFKKILKRNKIHHILIQLSIDYLKTKTYKDCCFYKDIKHLFDNLIYSKPLEEKKNFLFKMISAINKNTKELTYEQISKYLDIDKKDNKEKKEEENKEENKNENNEENKEENKEEIKNEEVNNENKNINNKDINNIEEKYNEEKFMSNEKINEMINKLNPDLENFGLLPYIEFKVKTNDKKIRKKIIIDTLRKDDINNHEKYLENNFEDSDFFYAIDKNFWDTLMDPNAEAQDYIDNSKIAEEINIMTVEDQYRKIDRERYEKEMEIERKKREDKENKKNKNKKQDKNNEKKTQVSNETKVEEKKPEEIIISKNAKLKPGLKYNQDFILLCGRLYSIIETNYKMNYKIKIKKIQEVINFHKYPSKESEKEKEKPEENKTKENEDKSQENKINQEESKKEKNTTIDTAVDIENEEELIAQENSIKEKLGKFIVDEEKGLITKYVRYNENVNVKEDEGKYILNEIDFYPVQVYTKLFGIIVREVEKAKEKYEELEKTKQFNESSERDKRRILEKQNREYQKQQERLQEYYDRKEKVKDRRMRDIITNEEYNKNLKELKEEYSDIFKKKEKTKDDFEVDISMEEFIDILGKYKNDILIENEKNIFLRQRYKTFKEVKKRIISDNYKTLKDKNYKIYYFLFSTKTLFLPQDDYCFEKEGKISDPFVCVIVDIDNEKGENFYDLLVKKQKEKEADPNNVRQKIVKEKDKDKDKGKNKTKEEKQKPMTDEEKRKLKEEQKRLKLEQERIKKEEKLKEKQMREEYEKKRRELEKEWAEREKEMRQKEREREQEKKRKEKEREQKLQREKELEKFISPPYGIDNYGNTCYFNSVNQIFLNMPILQQIFLDQRINLFINKNNKFGHQGKFFDLFKSLYWIKKSKVGDNVKDLKKMVGKLKQDFDNTNQQDANEYLNFLIENLHEEINMHASKPYIEDKDDIFGHNSVEIYGNITWSNSLRRNASFIDSVFMFQLKSNLKCRECGKVKYNFENNYMFDLPLSLCKMVTVEIYLYKLPFIYKLYYPEINEKFKKYYEENKNKNLSISYHLWNYYTDVLTLEEKKDHASSLHFSFDLEREKTMVDVIRILKGIKILELEQENFEELYKDSEIELSEIKHYTDLITYSKEKKKIIFPDQELDKYVNIEDKIIINVYEVLNTKGIQKLYEHYIDNIDRQFNLYSFTCLKEKAKNFGDLKNYLIKTPIGETINKEKNQKNKDNTEEKDNKNKIEKIKLISFNEKMIYLKDQEINKGKGQADKEFKCEFPLPVFHYKVTSKNSEYLFRDFIHEKIKDFPVQYIILNDINNISAKNLYEYIWNLNKLYMNHPNINKNDFWWNKINKDNNTIDKKEEKDSNNRLCYPFVLRYIEIKEKNDEDNYNKKLIHCPLCPWYTYCPGCIIDPRGDLSNISSSFGICVDWCYNFIEEELSTDNFKLIKDIDSQVISENLPIMDKNQNYQSVKDCFDLFFAEENLEDPLYCHQCRGPQNFSKQYSINRLPYVLILSLKRFKFNQNSNFKLRQMITYPLYDLDLEGKKYDLYGVINHYGSINSGHYTAIIKNKEKKWILCNDSSVYEIEEKRVMHSNAYILFYISKESPYNFDYIKMMKSFMNNIVEIGDKKNKKYAIKKDNNYFKYEPVMVNLDMKNNIGYVMEENISNFSVDEKYDIYDDLIKEDKIRVDGLKKKYGVDKEENKDDKKIEKNKDKEKKNEIKGDDKKEEKKEENNNKNEEQKNTIIKTEENKEKPEEKNEIKNEEKTLKDEENNKIDKNEIVENKTNENEIKENPESKKEENEIKEEKTESKDNKEIEDKTQKEEIKESTSHKVETEIKEKKELEKENEIKENNESNNETLETAEITEVKNENEEEKAKKLINGENKEATNLPDYYKDLIKIKFEFGYGYINKSRVKKILSLEENEKSKNKK